METKLDQQIQLLKSGVTKKLESKVETADLLQMKNEVRQQLEKLNDQLVNFKADQIQRLDSQLSKVDTAGIEFEEKLSQVNHSLEGSHQEIGRLKEQMKFLAKERAEDVNQISELMKVTQKKITQEVMKLNKELEGHIKQNHETQVNEMARLREDFEKRMDHELTDKVRVDEVQDALRRLTESFQHKIENLYTEVIRTVQTKNDDCYAGLERLKSDINELQYNSSQKVTQDQIEALLTQLDFLSKDLSLKSDKKTIQAQIDFLHETLTTVNKDMLLKANIQDVIILLDKKGNQDETQLELNWVKTALQKVQKETQAERLQ